VTQVSSKQHSGLTYFPPHKKGHFRSSPQDAYTFEVFAGPHRVDLAQGDCLFWLSTDRRIAHLTRGPQTVETAYFATLVRGFSPNTKTHELSETTVLPYINGCSTKQIFAPDRAGDPTWQLLSMPAHTTEQQHHIHSTARCVYILSGSGKCLLGMKKPTTLLLKSGGICVFDPMTPHHFETQSEKLVVLPVHVWSSSQDEHNHPMYNGTFRTS